MCVVHKENSDLHKENKHTMNDLLFTSQFLKQNFETIKDNLEECAHDYDDYRNVIKKPLLAGIVAGDNGRARRLEPTDFTDIGYELGYLDNNLAELIAFEYGMAIGYFEDLTEAAQWLVSDEEDFERIADHLADDLEDVTAEQLAESPMTITLAMALIDSYIPESDR